MSSSTLYIHSIPPPPLIRLESFSHLPPPTTNTFESTVTSPLPLLIHHEPSGDATRSYGSHGTADRRRKSGDERPDSRLHARVV
jgi:hypothetical protein